MSVDQDAFSQCLAVLASGEGNSLIVTLPVNSTIYNSDHDTLISAMEC